MRSRYGYLAQCQDDSAHPNLWQGLVSALAPHADRAGTLVRDWSPSHCHGVLTNATLSSALAYVQGVQCITLDASNDYIAVPQMQNIFGGVPACSLAAWAYRATSSTGMTLGWEPSDPYRWCWIWGNGIVYHTMGNNDSGSYVSASSSLSGWTHACIVFDGTLAFADRLKIYMNGIQISVSMGNNPAATMASAANLGALTHGSSGVRGISTGSIAEVLMYTRALAPSEIRKLATAPGTFAEPRRIFARQYTVPALDPALANHSAALPDLSLSAIGNPNVTASLSQTLPAMSVSAAANPVVAGSLVMELTLGTLGGGDLDDPPNSPFHLGFGSGFGFGSTPAEADITLPAPTLTAEAAAAVVGSVVTPLSTLSVATAAATSVVASASPTLDMSLSAAASPAAVGSLTQELPGFSFTISEVRVAEGSAAITLPGPSASATAEAEVVGSVVTPLSTLSVVTSASTPVAGAASITMPMCSVSAEGSQPPFEAELAVTLPEPTMASVAATTVTASATPTLDLTVTAVAALVNVGAVSQELPAATFSVASNPAAEGVVSQAMPDLTAEAEGEKSFAIVMTATLGMTVTVEAETSVEGTATITMPMLRHPRQKQALRTNTSVLFRAPGL
jgi:hypothetical protein